MKFFGFLIFLILAALAGSAVANDEDDAEVADCKQKCLELPSEPVCGTGKVTYWNNCERKCDNSELVHTGECEYKDLLDNKGIVNDI